MSSRFTTAWIPPIIAYCTASILMTLINKLVLSHFEYKVPFLMLGVQAVTSVLLLEIFTQIGWTKHRHLNEADAKRWFPVAILMAIMLYTGSKALQFLSVPVFTIFKNLSIIIVAYGETKVFGGHVTTLMLMSFCLMVVSSIIAANADLQSVSGDKEAKNNTIFGYIWMTTNCFSSAAFVLYMRYVIRKTASQGQFRDFDTVFYNNILTAPIFICMSLIGADGDLGQVWIYYMTHEEERNNFILALFFSGISAFWISYASSWCMRITNSTTYSMVGALNKLPIAISGLVVFHDMPITIGSVGSIMIGFASGILYTIAKLQYDKQQKKASNSPPLGSSINNGLPLSNNDYNSNVRLGNANGEDGEESSFLFKFEGPKSKRSSDSIDLAIQMFPLENVRSK